MEYNKCPFFSIGIPVHNSERYLSKCLESILKQDFIDFEIVCIDDCSDDNSAEIIEAFSEKDERVAVIRHGENKGILLTRKEIAENSKGRYFLWCDSDDELVPGALATFYEILSSHEEDDIGIIHSASLIAIDGKEQPNIIYSPVSPSKMTSEDAMAFVLTNNGLRSFPWVFVVPTKNVNAAFCEIPSLDVRAYVDDVLVSYKYLFDLKKIIFVQEDLYKYFIRKKSDSTDPLSNKRLCNTIRFTIDHLEKRNNHLKTTLVILYNLYLALCYSIGDKKKNNYGDVERIGRELRKIKKDIYAKKYISKKNKIQLSCLKHFPKIFYWYYSKKITRCSARS